MQIATRTIVMSQVSRFKIYTNLNKRIFNNNYQCKITVYIVRP